MITNRMVVVAAWKGGLWTNPVVAVVVAVVVADVVVAAAERKNAPPGLTMQCPLQRLKQYCFLR